MKEISVRVRSFSSTRSFSLLSNSPEAIFSFLFFQLNLFFIFFGLDWLRSGLFVWVWSRRFVRVQTGCVLVCLCGWGSDWLPRFVRVRTRCVLVCLCGWGSYWLLRFVWVRTGCVLVCSCGWG